MFDLLSFDESSFDSSSFFFDDPDPVEDGMARLYANYVATTLASNISDSANSIPLNAGVGAALFSWLTAGNDIVKVDGALGMYYIELTQTEANNAPGPIHGHLQPSGCARTYIEAQIGPSGMYSAVVDANVEQVNGVTINGAGTPASPWTS